MEGVTEIRRFTRAGSFDEARLEPENFSPRLLHCYLYVPRPAAARGSRLEKRTVMDFELEYITESDGAQVSCGRIYPVIRGDGGFRRPGQRTQGIMRYSCYCAIFDLEGKLRPGRKPYWGNPAKTEQPAFRSDFVDAIPPVTAAS